MSLRDLLDIGDHWRGLGDDQSLKLQVQDVREREAIRFKQGWWLGGAAALFAWGLRRRR
jgi:hypothetical protein